VKVIDPEGEFVGRQALNDQAQKLLDDLAAGFVAEEDEPATSGSNRRPDLAFRAARQPSVRADIAPLYYRR
jgi:hypothetical protein